MPQISVLMPSFNYARYLSLAVRAILTQTYQDFELVIVDDCSTDESRAIAEEFSRLDDRIVIISHDLNRGLASARNTALSASSGGLIALCDADDLWLPDKLRVQIEHLNTRNEICLVHSDAWIMDCDGQLVGQRFSELFHRPGQKTDGNLFCELCQRNFICVPSVIVRREALVRVGGFEEQLRSLEDWVCWTKLSTKYDFGYINDPLLQYRVHGDSLSRNGASMAENRAKALTILLASVQCIAPKALSQMHYSLGLSHLETGDTRSALASFKESLRTNPFHGRALFRGCQTLLKLASTMRSPN